MSYLDINSNQVIAHADGDTRQRFIRKTYLHLAAAVALFAALEFIMIKLGWHFVALQTVAKIGNIGFFAVILLFGFASSLMERWAHTSIALEKQYAAWVAGVVLEALIFLPIIGMAVVYFQDGNILQNASVVTLALVAGLTAVVFTTGKDFSFLRPMISMGIMVALGIILASFLFGFSLGLFFMGALIVISMGAILYTTSQIQHHYHESQYVGASLSLFASVGMLFWYVLQFMMTFAGSE